MPIVALGRLISSNTVVVRNSLEEAIEAVLTGAAGNAVTVGNIPGVWPQLVEFDNSNSSLDGASANPSFIWDSANATPGQRLGFAALINLPAAGDYVLSLRTFADNALNALIQVFPNADQAGIPPTSPIVSVSPVLTDGSLVADTQESLPFGWQNVRYYSNTFTVPEAINGTALTFPVRLVIAFDVQNYNTFGGINPAALAFVLDVYQEVDNGG